MKATFRSTLFAFLLWMASPADVQAQFNYSTDNGTITITGYTGPGGSVTIPDMINGLPVVCIGGHAFSFCGSLTSVTIGTSATSLGDYAFYGCSSLTRVTIPDSVTSLGNWAFSFCSSLTSVTIGTSTTSVGDYAFYHCDSLTSVTIPDSVTSLGVMAFSRCRSLTSVTIPDSVTSLGNWAFLYCRSLTRVTIPGSVTSIGDSTFYGCSNLTRVTIPDSVTSLGNLAFADCSSLSAITVDTNNRAYSSVDGVLFNKGQTTLLQCPAGKAGSYTIPDSVTSLGDSAFSSCYSLTRVMIGNSVTGVGAEAFLLCSSLTSVTIPDSVSSIGNMAFHGCTSLTGVYFQGKAPRLGSNVFFAAPPSLRLYYLPGTEGWGPQLGGRPTALWVLPYPVILTSGSQFGVQPGGFGFTISWATNASVVVEACADPAHPTWSPVSTNSLSDGRSYFTDPDWAKYPARFYHGRQP